MNITDYLKTGDPPPPKNGDYLAAMWLQQKGLEEKYIVIEMEKNQRWSGSIPVDWDDKLGQMQIKDFVFRIIAELFEGAEALEAPEINTDHFYEEMSDALHFYLALFQLTGLGLNQARGPWRAVKRVPHSLVLDHNQPIVRLHIFYTTLYLIQATECLKNKPWKQTEMPTDKPKFIEMLEMGLARLLTLFRGLGLDDEGIHRLYWAKTEVNKFRQRSNY